MHSRAGQRKLCMLCCSPGDRLQSGDPLLGDVGADGLQGPHGRLSPCSCANLGGQRCVLQQHKEHPINCVIWEASDDSSTRSFLTSFPNKRPKMHTTAVQGAPCQLPILTKASNTSCNKTRSTLSNFPSAKPTIHITAVQRAPSNLPEEGQHCILQQYKDHLTKDPK